MCFVRLFDFWWFGVFFCGFLGLLQMFLVLLAVSWVLHLKHLADCFKGHGVLMLSDLLRMMLDGWFCSGFEVLKVLAGFGMVALLWLCSGCINRVRALLCIFWLFRWLGSEKYAQTTFSIHQKQSLLFGIVRSADLQTLAYSNAVASKG